MKVDNFAWLFPISLIVTIVFALVALGLAICWWLIFKLTVRRFNTEERHDDR